MVSFCCCSCGDDELEDSPFYTNFNSLLLSLLQCFCWGNTSTSWVTSTQSTESCMNVESRPLPFDADQRCRRSQRDGLFSRREKPTANFQEASLPLMRNKSTSNVEVLGSGKIPIGVESLEDDKDARAESSRNLMTPKVSPGILYVQPSPEEEDVCPTCLEEYTKENPKITTQCSHHFHLGCIYEWMERSDNCPVCGKEMEFCESP